MSLGTGVKIFERATFAGSIVSRALITRRDGIESIRFCLIGYYISICEQDGGRGEGGRILPLAD